MRVCGSTGTRYWTRGGSARKEHGTGERREWSGACWALECTQAERMARGRRAQKGVRERAYLAARTYCGRDDGCIRVVGPAQDPSERTCARTAECLSVVVALRGLPGVAHSRGTDARPRPRRPGAPTAGQAQRKRERKAISQNQKIIWWAVGHATSEQARPLFHTPELKPFRVSPGHVRSTRSPL